MAMSRSTRGHINSGAILTVVLLSGPACGGELAPDPPATRQECLAAADFAEPSTSPYCLPFPIGASHSVSQSYCSPPPGSHEDETISLYLHLRYQGVVPEMGDSVPMGGLLGYSGNTGDSSGFPHLHFQVCLRGGMCSWKTGEYTLPVSFKNALGPIDSRGGLLLGSSYEAGNCS
jgi:hypothetical protein